MFDGNLNTYWHPKMHSSKSYVWVEFLSLKTVNKVMIKKRQHNNSKHYNKDSYSMCFKLKDDNKKEIESKCTADKLGNPYLKDKDTIEVTFNTVKNVRFVELDWSNSPGSVAELYVYGVNQN